MQDGLKIDTRKLYYPNTGWADFEMYEYLL